MSQMGSAGIGSVGVSPIQTIVTDSGSVTPINGVVNVVGSANITTQELSNNVVISLKNSISINSLISGDIDISGNAISAQNDFDIALSPNGLGKVELSYASPNSQLSVDATKNIIASSSMTDGQLLIGSSTGAPAPSTLTAGPGIQITNSPGSVTVTNKGVGGGFKRWETLSYGGPSYTQRYQLEPNVGYIANSWYNYKAQGSIKKPVIMTLPPNDQLSIGDTIMVTTVGGGGCIVNANQNQTVTWCAYKYGSGAYPSIYQLNTSGTLTQSPAFNYGWGIQPGNYPGNSTSAPYYDQPESIWFVVIDFQNGGAILYIYKVYQYWQIVRAL